MASEFTIIQILEFAQISQYISGNDKSSLKQLQSGSFIGNLSRLLYMEGTLLQNLNSLNPSSSTLRGTAEYVLSLCGKYLLQAQNIINGLAGSPPVISGPSNQSVNVGQTATFSVSVTGTAPFTYKWFLNGNPIIGATSSTYWVPNAQLSDSGGLYSVQVTNSAGQATSNTATLTVTASIQAFWYYGSADPYPALSMGVDNLTYQISQSITHNTPIVITYPTAAENNQYTVLRYPITENAKTAWVNTQLNQGQIPDSIMRAIFTIGNNQYVVSRVAMSLDSTASTLTYS